MNSTPHPSITPKVTLRAGLLALAGFFAFALSPSVQAQPSVDELVQDMKLNHEATPRGVPSYYGWYTKGRIGLGHYKPEAKAAILWGQIYEEVSGNPSSSARVQIGASRLAVKYGSTWYTVQDLSGYWVQGSSYPETFNGSNRAGDVVYVDGMGAARAGCKATSGCGYNYHFFPSWRAGVNGSTATGMAGKIRARLIYDSSAKYLLNCGADYYTATSYGTNLYDVAMGRFKKVTSSWRNFTFHTLTESQLRANPPGNKL